jgi:hypothetical protein
MRSPRSWFEIGCRLGAFALLGWLIGGSLIPVQPRRVERVRSPLLAGRLAPWTTAPGRLAMHVDVEDVPEAWTVEWLAALRRTGREVSWSGTPAPVAITSEPVADPLGGARVDLAAPGGATVVLRDVAGALDSVRVRGNGATLIEPLLVERVDAMAAGQRLSAPAPAAANVRRVVVVGRAGWEGKFVVSALEEAGWRVSPRFALAPGIEVAGADPIVLDTAHVSAVIALDTSVTSLGGAVARFVRDGGGLILAGGAAAAENVAAIAPGTPGARVPPATPGAIALTLASAGFYPVTSLHRDAVPVDRRAEAHTVVARRVGAGRVIQVAFDETWRWRMAGEQGAEGAHRRWWSRVVGSVAYLPAGARDDAAPPRAREWDGAPLASLIHRIGPPRASSVLPRARWSPDPRLLLSLICILLLLEWGSRRLRGAK